MSLHMKNFLCFLLSLISIAAFSQATPRESLEPKVTEVWDLKPTKITPGSHPGAAPSDAIVLFDGKDLSKWSTMAGADAKWEVKDGALSVAKGTGDIKSKQA